MDQYSQCKSSGTFAGLAVTNPRHSIAMMTEHNGNLAGYDEPCSERGSK